MTVRARCFASGALVIAASCGLLSGCTGVSNVAPAPPLNSIQSLASVAIQPDYQNVWVHYDYFVFPKGWTSLAGVTYPNGLSMAPTPSAIQKVVAAYAAQGLTLHVDPLHTAIGGHQVIIPDFDSWISSNPTCVGSDAVRFTALKNQYFHPLGHHPWHYAIFGFNVVLPDTGDRSLCAPEPVSGVFPDPLASGFSELPGFNFVVAFGADIDQGFSLDDYRIGGTFMHELGHNFGLMHGGVQTPINSSEDFLAYKPAYISVMDYLYQNGIRFSAAPGSTVPVGLRLDYSRAALAPLNEADLNEFAGVNAGTTDIILYFCNGALAFGPAQGPIDWNCDGALESAATGDIDNDNGTPNTTLHGFDDWTYVKQTLLIPPDAIELMPRKSQYENASKGVVSPLGLRRLPAR